MFLNRLEIVGFKSFAERVKIEFNSGITAVVGPNGSGKSNIIDSVRWVLGEQSARSLRGQRMEDIIFQGSDSRPALNFAEVALILNNKENHLPVDYEEVNITRRVYRSGDSEFYINKQACRLKDIVDLFTDTGLGKESFSIIGQGKIDDILSSKAEERRDIFEEAAGVLKYKQRKLKAEHKLNETKENLLRVEDIIYEINTQLTPLKEQAEKATKYKNYQAQLKEVEIKLLITEIKQVHSQWESLLADIEVGKDKEVQMQASIQKEEALLSQKRGHLHELEEEVNHLQDRLLQLTEQIEHLEGKRNVMIERYKHMTENKTAYQSQLSDSEKQYEQVEALLNEQEALKERLEKDISKIKEEHSHIEYVLTHGAQDIEAKIEHLKSDYIEYLNEQAVNANDYERLQEQLAHLEKDHAADDQTIHSYQEQFAQLTDEVKKLDKAVKKQSAYVKSLEEKRQQLREDLSAQAEELDKMRRQLYAGNEQIATLVSRQETLEEMKESFQGYFFSVKEILKAAKEGKIKDIHGAVVDLIDVKSQYVTAIETILGGQAQHIVVAHDDHARAAIQWLKKENKGRATFLPIASLQERHLPSSLLDKVRQAKGFVALANELVSTKETYRKVVNHLMGNVIVAETLKDATAIAQLTNRRFRVVTLDGDLVNPGGAMSGGAKKRANQQTIFTREKELKNLREKVANFKARAQAFAQEVEAKEAAQIERQQADLQLNESLEKAQSTLREQEADLDQQRRDLSHVKNDVHLYEMQEKQYKDQREQLQADLLAKAAHAEEMKAKIDQTEKEINRLTEEVDQLSEKRRHKEAEKHELDKQMVERNERLKNVQFRIQDYKTQLSSLKETKHDLKERLAEIKELETEHVSEATMKTQVDQLKAEREEKAALIEEKRQIRRRESQETEDMGRELKEKERLHQKHVEHIQAKEIEASRLDVTLENHLNHLQTEYITTYERASEEYEEVANIVAAKGEVEEIKQLMARLGTVNLGAIEEYDRLLERYSFLDEQKTDLLEAKATLHEVIDEMDEEMIKRFGHMFADIQAAFSDVFKKLFGGGHAELILTDKDNLLETGIDIVASPPGKKQKALSLLSGGERALTAIALQFAILRVKPVPFCILDEVDASLDEANVARFANYLNHYSDGTQFIVITHRKGTMEEANVLYGVTMQESCVSRLVSVRLEDAEQLVDVT